MNFQTVLSNFALILFVLTVVTGVIWFLDVFHLSRQRRSKAASALAEFDARIAAQKGEGRKVDETGRAALEASLLRQPTWIEYSGSLFPVIALVFFLRSFLYEPFKIPSSSMVPTFEVGDLILVNKFTYGIRLPIISKKIIDINDPQRGDVMVFKYPLDPSLDYIKRVVGVPGDRIAYKNKRLEINGEAVQYEQLPDYVDVERLSYSKQYSENLSGVKHKILIDERVTGAFAQIPSFSGSEMCTYEGLDFTCTVPPGHYFTMGDNRDNSLDSRYWGFVPDRNIVGKAFFVWMNLGNLKRIGSFQ